MRIEKREQDRPDATVLLKNLKGGDVFHFAADSFDGALKCDAIYMVVSGGKESRIQITNLKDGLLLQRDDCHKVILLNTSIVLDT